MSDKAATFKCSHFGCTEPLLLVDVYHCAACDGKFHKGCLLQHLDTGFQLCYVRVFRDLVKEFDPQIYPEQAKEDFDAPDDREYNVNITAGLWRKLSQLTRQSGTWDGSGL